MKRLMKPFSILLAGILILSILLTAAPALAEAAGDSLPPDYISYGDYGDTLGGLQALLGIDERDEVSRKPCFGADTRDALESFQREHGLDVSGEFDAETLCLLLGLDVQQPSEAPLVWIPMHSGACYHAAANCSGMLAPQQMPEACATALSFIACQHCFPSPEK